MKSLLWGPFYCKPRNDYTQLICFDGVVCVNVCFCPLQILMSVPLRGHVTTSASTTRGALSVCVTKVTVSMASHTVAVSSQFQYQPMVKKKIHNLMDKLTSVRNRY